jgi:two-component system, OmpR family, sensor histidine kinase KdpD
VSATASKSRSEPAARARPRGFRVALWIALAALLTLALWLVRDEVEKSHTALAFLVLVLAGSATDGRIVGLVLSVVCFLAFNFFLLPPFYTFRIAQPIDWAVLAAFLVTAGVAAELLHRQQVAVQRAEARAREMDRLAALGADCLSVARASDAVEAVARMIAAELPVDEARIELLDEANAPGMSGAITDSGLRMWVAREGRAAAMTIEGTVHTEVSGTTLAALLPRASRFTEVLAPLAVRGRMLGVLHLVRRDGLQFDEAQASFADVLAYYGALAAERVRLAAEAERVQALREADRIKDALLASVSHDLRTPLTSIRATASELRAEGEVRGGLIEEEAVRLNDLVADLLDLSRLRANAFPVVPETNTAEDLIGAALQRLRSVAGAADIIVQLPATGVPIGHFDFVQSLRALTNLIENALRHSPAEARVEIDVRADDDGLLIEVADRGPGIVAADLDRLFEPFFRSALTTSVEGTGLGLAIASRIAEAQGGSVTYHPRPGGGSVFGLRLPFATLES